MSLDIRAAILDQARAILVNPTPLQRHDAIADLRAPPPNAPAPQISLPASSVSREEDSLTSLTVPATIPLWDDSASVTLHNLSLNDVINLGITSVAKLHDEYLLQSRTVVRLADELLSANKEKEETKRKYLELLHDSTMTPQQASTSLLLHPKDADCSLAPSDSVSQRPRSASTPDRSNSSTPAIPKLIEQPTKRPAGIPESVLWDQEDAFKCTHVKINPANKWRPPARPCIRTLSGSIISETLWNNIRLRLHTANRVIKDILHPLVKDQSISVPCRKKYFKENWPREWDDALAKLEDREPVLQHCSRHWKAELVLAHGLDSQSGKVVKTATKATVSAANSDESVASLSQQPLASQPPEDSVQPPPEAPAQPPPEAPVQPRPETPEGLPPPQAAVQLPFRAPVSSTGPPASPLKFSKHKRDTNSPAAQQKKRKYFRRGRLTETLESPDVIVSPAHEEPSKIDISGIKVPASYEALTDIVANDVKLQTVPHALDLLEILRKLPETAEAPSSPAVEEFLVGIEQADPNSSDVDEDNTNGSWGHYHFCSGTVRFDNLTWEQVANKKTAYRILAATIKTCRVACHLCFKRNITVDGVVADMYFETIVQNLWKGDLEKMHESLPSSDISGQQGPDLPAALSKLQTFRVAQLKALVKSLKVPIPKGKKGRPTKSDYLTVLATQSVTDINEHLGENMQI